jgi:hypothetical protein
MVFKSVLYVEETGVPGENLRPAASHWQTWSHERQFLEIKEQVVISYHWRI